MTQVGIAGATGFRDGSGAETTKRGFTAVDWFVLVVVADGFLAFAQEVAYGGNLPLELAARCLLVLQFAVAVLIGTRRIVRPPAYLAFAILLNAAANLLPVLMLLAAGADVTLAVRTVYFMYGIGFLTLFALFVPMGLSGIPLFTVFFAVCMGFGAAQVVTQDLLLPEAVKAGFGIQYEQFANGQIRAVSFFASAPRFAEMLVFVSLWLLFGILEGRGRVLLRLAVYAITLWLLYNTYSRSGYVLWLAGTAVAVVMARRRVFRASSVAGLFARLIVVTAGVMAATAAAMTVRPETLAVYDLTSMVARLNQWALQSADFASADTVRLLFGTGEAPLFSRSETDYYAIDNLILIMLRYGGLLGLCGFLLCSVAVFVAARKATGANDRAMAALTAFYAGLFAEGMFVDNHNTIHLTQFVLLVLVMSRRRAAQGR